MKHNLRCTGKLCRVEKLEMEASSSSSCAAAIPISTQSIYSFKAAQEVPLDDEDLLVVESTMHPQDDDHPLHVNFLEERRIASRLYY